jgi:hypothetical protein
MTDEGPFSTDEPTARPRRRWLGLPSRSDIPPDVQQEMERARAEPGPSWRAWFLFQGAKWWVGLGFLTVDVWIVVGAFQGQNLAITVGLLALALYLEVLLFEFLWHRPDPAHRHGAASPRSRWIHPVPVGRWTPEAVAARAGLNLPAGEGAPDAREFL